MPLGDIAVIGSSATFFTCVYARIFLKEKLELGHFINIAFVVVGLMLIVQVNILRRNSSDNKFNFTVNSI